MKLDNKGFAISGIMYSILLLFLIILVGILSMLSTRKVVLDKLKSGIYLKLNSKLISDRQEYKFYYTGNAQEFIAPTDGNYKIELWGASYNINAGGYTSGNLKLNKNSKFYLYIGGETSESTGGYNGGGVALINDQGISATGGNGATDIRLTSGSWSSEISLNSRLMVAAGSGGIVNTLDAHLVGRAGGLIGYDGDTSIPQNMIYNGKGGTQINGGPKPTEHSCSTKPSTAGTFGIGGNGGASSLTANVGGGHGGGGGYYGGSGGSGLCNGYLYSGGGSSYISGHTGSVAITSEISQMPKSGCTTGTTDVTCSVHYSGLNFTNTTMIDGSGYDWTNKKGNQIQMPKTTGGYYELGQGHIGNGFARITYLDS